jgi:hypothetical protein
MRYFLTVLLASALGACGGLEIGADAGVSSTTGSVSAGGSGGGGGGGGGDETTDGDAGGGGVGVGGGGCPARADAAVCPAIPSVVAPPAPPPGAPGFPIDPGSAWVGCQYTSCSSASACTTCTCVADDAGAAWDCTDRGLQTEGDAQPTPYCALYSGPVDASDQADAGPIERCTAQYPTCSAPAPESPGWQCCRIATSGALTEVSCMPSDAAAPFPR